MAGLAAAWACHRRGLTSVVLEATERVGGIVSTVHSGGLVLDGGPDAFLATKPGAMTLCRELGLERDLVPMSSPRGAFILSEGRFHRLPEGGAFGVPVSARAFATSRLLSWRGKLRVAMEPFVRRAPWPVSHDESARAFFARRFGTEAAERIAQPLLGGIHAGRLETLSARAVLPALVDIEASGRSVWLTLRRQAGHPQPGGVFRSFLDGMGRLPAALAAALPQETIRTQATATGLARTPDGAWAVQVGDHGSHVGDIVLLAVPAWRAASLLVGCAPRAARLCDEVPYVSSATVLLAYDSGAVATRLHGSGYVIARRVSGDPVMAVTWVTSKWPGRAAPGTTLIRAFFGGEGHEAALAADDGQLVSLAHHHMERWWGVRAAPRVSHTFRWSRGSPQHVVGHPARMRQLQETLDSLGAVGVAGSGFRVVGIPDVVSDARAEMDRLITQWQQR